MNRPNEDVIERVLDNCASPSEARSVAEWFTTVEGERQMSERMSDDFCSIERGEIPLADNIPSEELYARLVRHFRRKRAERILFRVAAILIPCALLFGVGYKLESQIGGLFTPMEYAELYVPRGERMHMVFQDGTHVYINSETRIRYPKKFGLTRREVDLDGEAYFEVAHNAQRPFRVNLDKSSINVLGTSFDVMAYKSEPHISVTLDEGCVNMTDGDNTYKMAPSQQLIYDKSARRGRLVKTGDSHLSSRWTRNVLTFRDASLVEVAKVLGRWYDVDFEVKDQLAHKYYYTLESENVPLDTILREMERIAPVLFARNGDKIEVTLR